MLEREGRGVVALVAVVVYFFFFLTGTSIFLYFSQIERKHQSIQ